MKVALNFKLARIERDIERSMAKKTRRQHRRVHKIYIISLCVDVKTHKRIEISKYMALTHTHIQYPVEFLLGIIIIRKSNTNDFLIAGLDKLFAYK